MTDVLEDDYEDGVLEELSSSPTFGAFQDNSEDDDAFLDMIDSHSEQNSFGIHDSNRDENENAWLDADEWLGGTLEHTTGPNIIEITREEEIEETEQREMPGSDSESEEEPDAKAVLLHKIQDLILSIVKQIADCAKGKHDRVVIELADRHKQGTINGEIAVRKLAFPRSRQDASLRGLVVICAVATYIYEALVADLPITKRDIYYRDVDLFRKQSVVDNAVDDLAATFGVERGALLVRASSKGVFCGSVLSIRLTNGTTVRGNDRQATLIPAGEDIEGLIVEEDIGWVLVVEKEAIFQTLCQAEFARTNVLQKPGIILTGKGYPDVASRQLLHKLSSGLPETVPIFALVDADPFGVEILSVYAFGSRSMRHQNDGLTAERMVWIGVMLSELEPRGVAAGNLLQLSQRDKKKIESLLLREEETMPQPWKNELQLMLDRGHKAEIEAVYSCGSQEGRQPLVSYVEEKLESCFVAGM